MEGAKYPTLRRPKRKLCYITSQENQPNQWKGPLTLEDVDKMFDDLDSSPHEDLPATSPLRQTFDMEPDLNEMELSPIPLEDSATETPHPASNLQCSKPDDASDIPCKGPQPVKTSSPIDHNMEAKLVEKQDEVKGRAVSPLLFPVENDVQEVPSEPPAAENPPQQPQCNGQLTEESGLSELESPPTKVVLHKTPNHKTKPETSQRQENTEPPVVAVRQEPEVAAPETNSKDISREPPEVTVTCVGNDLTAFLQKLKEAGQSKLSSSRKPVVPVKVATPEPEDDFLILEDDAAFQFSIPSKNVPRRRQKQSKSSSSDKESLTERGSGKVSPQETPRSQEEPDRGSPELEGLTVHRKVKKKKHEEKKEDDVADPERKAEELQLKEKKPNKKKRQPQKVESTESDRAESRAEDGAGSETEDSSQKPETKDSSHKPETKDSSQKPETKARNKPESKKVSKANTKTSRTKPSKGTRKKLQPSDAVQEAISDVVEDPVATEDFTTPTKNKFVKSDSNGNAKQQQSPAVPKSSSSEDGQVVGKRKRKPTGAWWLNGSQSAEETDGQQHTVKKLKQNSKKQNVASSPLKENRKALKKDQKVASPISVRPTNKAKGRKTTKNQRKNTTEATTKKEVAASEVSETAEEEQPEEQQHEVPDPELEQDQSSPLVSSHRDHSADSAVSHPPTHREEQLREAGSAKRRRRPTGSWWMLNHHRAEDVESVPSQTPKLHRGEAKARRGRKKLIHRADSPGPPTRGSGDVVSGPAGGAPASPLKPVPMFTPKTVKRSLAKFTDIFTTGMASPRVGNVRDTLQSDRHKVASCPVEEAAPSDHSGTSRGTLGVDDGEDRSPGDDLQESNTQQDSTSKILVSGPASMIELEEFDENDDTNLPSSKVQTLLSVSDLCGPPLKPLTLQLQDKTNMAEWFKSLWVTSAKNDAEVTPEQFDWYFYQDKAMGLQEDQNNGPICTGKILLGSFMKKPLWVDHSATTAFHLLSSSVSVTVDGSASHFGPGQSFIVHCGHAYSIKNATKQPAVLCFTRMLAESSD